jgi:hypothetical protein
MDIFQNNTGYVEEKPRTHLLEINSLMPELNTSA